MNKNKARNAIYIRIFSAFLIIYSVLMAGFGVFLVYLEKDAAVKELAGYSRQISDITEEILGDSIDGDNQITDIVKVKKNFLKKSPAYPLMDAEAAIFTSDYKLIYNTNDYWICVYSEPVDENRSTNEYGVMNPRDWFGEEEIMELENYLYAEPKAEKYRDLSEYLVSIDGLWLEGEMIIPDIIRVIPMYATEFDEKGDVTTSSGTRKANLVYKSRNKKNTKDLPYYEHGSIFPAYGENRSSESRNEIREMVSDELNLKNFIDGIPSRLASAKLRESEYFALSVKKINNLTYRYYMVVPYKSSMEIRADQRVHSDFWTVVGVDINIWEHVSATLAYVCTSCFIIFTIAAYILSRQTYKIYLKGAAIERQRKEMTDALAHDLKTPLSIISGYAQNLQENIHTEKREHYAGSIQANVKRMDKIIKRMLEMSKLESDYFEMQLEDVSLNEISSEIINRYKSICDDKFLRVSLEGEAVIRADRLLLERVIDNFFINAIDNMHEGGVVSIAINEDIFEIYNSGSHIPEDIINDIWLPYKKTDMGRNNTKGTGLGLSIAGKILELHRFSYGAKNNDNGVTFWFKHSGRDLGASKSGNKMSF